MDEALKKAIARKRKFDDVTASNDDPTFPGLERGTANDSLRAIDPQAMGPRMVEDRIVA